MGLVMTAIDEKNAPESFTVITQILLEGKELKKVWESWSRDRRKKAFHRVIQGMRKDYHPIHELWFDVPYEVGFADKRKLGSFSKKHYIDLAKVDRDLFEDSLKRHWRAEFSEHKDNEALQKDLDKGFLITFTIWRGLLRHMLGIDQAPRKDDKTIFQGTKDEVKKRLIAKVKKTLGAGNNYQTLKAVGVTITLLLVGSVVVRFVQK